MSPPGSADLGEPPWREADLRSAVEEHLPLVRVIVAGMAAHFPAHVERSELAGAGALALVQAARRYDRTRGVPFRGFAAQRIRGAVLDAARAADWAPRSLRVEARALRSAEDELSGGLGRAPSSQELADHLTTTVEELRRLRERIHRAVVLRLEHDAVEQEGGWTVGDTVVDTEHPAPPDGLERRELHAWLRAAVGLLPDPYGLVIRAFLDGQAPAVPARHLGVTTSRVSQLRSEALAMLRAGITAEFEETPRRPFPTGGTAAARREADFLAAASTSGSWRRCLDDVGLAA